MTKKWRDATRPRITCLFDQPMRAVQIVPYSADPLQVSEQLELEPNLNSNFDVTSTLNFPSEMSITKIQLSHWLSGHHPLSIDSLSELAFIQLELDLNDVSSWCRSGPWIQPGFAFQLFTWVVCLGARRIRCSPGLFRVTSSYIRGPLDYWVSMVYLVISCI